MSKLFALIPASVLGLAAYALAFRAIPPGGLAASADELLRQAGPGLAGLIFSVICLAIVLLIRRGESDADATA